MARGIPYLRLLALVCCVASLAICSIAGAPVRTISDAHRSVALELFSSLDGSSPSLEESYEALKTFQILRLEKSFDKSKACPAVLETLGSSASKTKDFFDALRVNSILECKIGAQTFEDVASKLKLVIKDADSLLDFYYSILGLVYIKAKGFTIVLPDADGVFHSIKALSQSDGRWRYDSHNALSCTHAAGLALEALAGVISLSDLEVNQSKRRRERKRRERRRERGRDEREKRRDGKLTRRMRERASDRTLEKVESTDAGTGLGGHGSSWRTPEQQQAAAVAQEGSGGGAGRQAVADAGDGRGGRQRRT